MATIAVGDLVEVFGPFERSNGTVCIVQGIRGVTATVQPVDDSDERFLPVGDTAEVNVGLLVKLPTPTQLRAEKRKFREAHLAARRATNPAPVFREGSIRKFKQDWRTGGVPGEF